MVLSAHSLYRRGFNLVEAAIVLGVIGLVIGGIWVAAASVQENMRVNETVTLIKSVVESTNRMYAGMPLPTSGTITLTPTLISAGIIPSSIVVGSVAQSAWGKAVDVDLRTAPMKLRVYFQDMPSKICARVAPRIFANGDVNTGVAELGADIMYPAGGSALMVGQAVTTWVTRCTNASGVLTGYSWFEFQFPSPR